MDKVSLDGAVDTCPGQGASGNCEGTLGLTEREVCPPSFGLYVGLGEGATRLYQNRYGVVSHEGRALAEARTLPSGPFSVWLVALLLLSYQGSHRTLREGASMTVPTARSLVPTGQGCRGLCPQCEKQPACYAWPAGATVACCAAPVANPPPWHHRHGTCVSCFPAYLVQEGLASDRAKLVNAERVRW